MAKYKVGDRVKIRQWDDMEKEFGLNDFGSIKCACGFVDNMKSLCGRTATIKEIDGVDIELKFDDESGDTFWSYSTDMIEPIEEEFHEFDTVKHFKFGIGTVVGEEDSNGNVQVDFDEWNEDFPFLVGSENCVLINRHGLTLIKAYSPK